MFVWLESEDVEEGGRKKEKEREGRQKEANKNSSHNLNAPIFFHAQVSRKGFQACTRFPEQVLFSFCEATVLISSQSHKALSTASMAHTKRNRGSLPNYELCGGVQLAEKRISDIIRQNDRQALKFKRYGKNFIMNHWLITGSFLQVACYAGHFGPYGERHFRVFNVFGRLSVCVGRIDCVCEPATTRAFLPSGKEAIGWLVQLECCVHKGRGGSCSLKP